VQKYLETTIAKAILRGDFQGGDTIAITVQDERLHFQKKAGSLSPV
jgi:ATP-dependent Clp protease ATP-binding subunit ClpB